MKLLEPVLSILGFFCILGACLVSVIGSWLWMMILFGAGLMFMFLLTKVESYNKRHL